MAIVGCTILELQTCKDGRKAYNSCIFSNDSDIRTPGMKKRKQMIDHPHSSTLPANSQNHREKVSQRKGFTMLNKAVLYGQILSASAPEVFESSNGGKSSAVDDVPAMVQDMDVHPESPYLKTGVKRQPNTHQNSHHPIVVQWNLSIAVTQEPKKIWPYYRGGRKAEYNRGME